MIRQQFDVDRYWKVTVYYDYDGDFSLLLLKELESVGFSLTEGKDVLDEIVTGRAKAVTCSSGIYHKSIIVLGKHKTIKDYLNSIVHEAEHVKQAMLAAYNVRDSGESPAYTMGYIIGEMYTVFREIVCGCVYY